MKQILFFVLLSIVSTQTYASPEVIQVIEKPTNTVTIYQGSSEFHRMNKRFSFNWEMLGAGPTNAGKGGLSAAYFLDRNTLLLLDASEGQTTGQYAFSFSDDNFEHRGKSIGLYLKKFLGNSFYLKSGIEYRDIQHSYTNDSFTYNYSFAGKSYGAAILIGNQWQWDNFTLGCDWVGLGIPVASEITSEKVSSVTYSDELNNAQSRYVTGPYIQLMRFYIGYSF